MGPRAGLDRRKISSPPGSDPGPLEVEYLTELRNWMALSLKFGDKSGQAFFTTKAEGKLVFPQRTQNGAFWCRAATG